MHQKLYFTISIEILIGKLYKYLIKIELGKDDITDLTGQNALKTAEIGRFFHQIVELLPYKILKFQPRAFLPKKKELSIKKDDFSIFSHVLENSSLLNTKG